MSRTYYLLTTLISLILIAGFFAWPPSAGQSSRAGDRSSPPAAAVTNVRQPVEPWQGLGSLPYLTRARSRSICAENPTGAKGKAAMAVPDPAGSNSRSARLYG